MGGRTQNRKQGRNHHNPTHRSKPFNSQIPLPSRSSLGARDEQIHSQRICIQHSHKGCWPVDPKHNSSVPIDVLARIFLNAPTCKITQSVKMNKSVGNGRVRSSRQQIIISHGSVSCGRTPFETTIEGTDICTAT